jgi:hypothetical protein
MYKFRKPKRNRLSVGAIIIIATEEQNGTEINHSYSRNFDLNQVIFLIRCKKTIIAESVAAAPANKITQPANEQTRKVAKLAQFHL